MRKQRALLQLQDARQGIQTSMTPPLDDAAGLQLQAEESECILRRGIKCSRSESADLEAIEPCPPEEDWPWISYIETGRTLPVTTIYEGNSRKEFNSFKRKLAEHFAVNGQLFANERYQVLEALRHVSRSIAERWMIHSEWKEDDSWLEFHSFLDQQLPTTRYTSLYAESLYQTAKQRENQSIHQFMRYLSGLEAAMPRLFDEEQRSLKLWHGTIPKVCQVSRVLPYDSCFNALVDSLEKAEASLPQRVQALGGSIPARGTSDEKTRRSKRSKKRRRT